MTRVIGLIVLAVAVSVGPSRGAIASGAPGLRLAHDPIVALHQLSVGTPSLEVYVRLRGSIARSPSGSPLGGAQVNGVGRQLPPTGDPKAVGWGFTTVGSKARACYGLSLHP